MAQLIGPGPASKTIFLFRRHFAGYLSLQVWDKTEAKQMEDTLLRAIVREKEAEPSLGVFEFLVLPRVGDGIILRGTGDREEKYSVVGIDHRPARAGVLHHIPEVIIIVAPTR